MNYQRISALEKMSILERCIGVMVDQDENNGDGCTPAGGKKCFMDTLSYFRGMWFIWYNDKNDSTSMAGVKYGF